MPNVQTAISASANTEAAVFVSEIDGADAVQCDVEDGTHLRVYVNDAVAYDFTIGVQQNPTHAALMAALWSQGMEMAHIDTRGHVTVTDMDLDGLATFDAAPFGAEPMYSPEGPLAATLTALFGVLGWKKGDQYFVNAAGVSTQGFLGTSDAQAVA